MGHLLDGTLTGGLDWSWRLVVTWQERWWSAWNVSCSALATGHTCYRFALCYKNGGTLDGLFFSYKTVHRTFCLVSSPASFAMRPAMQIPIRCLALHWRALLGFLLSQWARKCFSTCSIVFLTLPRPRPSVSPLSILVFALAARGNLQSQVGNVASIDPAVNGGHLSFCAL